MLRPAELNLSDSRVPIELGPNEDINSRTVGFRMSDEEFARLAAEADRIIRPFIHAGCPGVPAAIRNLVFEPDAKT